MKLYQKIYLGLSIFALSYNTCVAAPLSPDKYEQQQTAKRQIKEQEARINAPAVKNEEKQILSSEVVLPKEKVKYKIDSFVIDDDNTGRFQWLLKDLKKYEHRRIGAKGISTIMKYLQGRIMNRGFITTRILVPEQDISSKQLVFKVRLGIIEDIKFADEKKIGTAKNAFYSKSGDLLNIYDLDQGLEQMKRVPRQDVKMKLLPGKETGKSVVMLDVNRERFWSAGISWDDSGLYSTGKHQMTGDLAIYNPMNWNDILSVSYTNDTENDSTLSSKNYSFYYSVPYGKYTFSVNHYRNEYEQDVPALVQYTQKGVTSTWDFGVQRLLYRNNSRKIQASAKIIHRHKQGYLNNEEVKVQELQTTAYQLGLMQRQYVGAGTIDAMVYFQKGVPILGAMAGWDDFDPNYMTTRYNMWGFTFYYGIPFKMFEGNARYSLTSRGQFTEGMLYAVDQFSIGGRYSVKGFRGENSLSAENGFVVRNELSFPIEKLNAEPYIGVDYGRVWGKSDEYNVGSKLAGAYIGIRGKIVNRLTYDGFVGTPIYKPEGFKAGKTACGFNLYLQI